MNSKVAAYFSNSASKKYHFQVGRYPCTGCTDITLALQQSLLGVTITMVGSVSQVAWIGAPISMAGAGSISLPFVHAGAAAVFTDGVLYNRYHA